MSLAVALRHRFYSALWLAMKVVWPIFSALLGLVVVLGLLIAWIEDWGLFDGIYFALVTGLTVGYGDFVQKHGISRIPIKSFSRTCRQLFPANLPSS